MMMMMMTVSQWHALSSVSVQAAKIFDCEPARTDTVPLRGSQ